MQILDIHTEDLDMSATSDKKYHQYWISALLSGSTNLTSLSMVADGIPWTPVLGLLPLRHLELTMRWVQPWLDVIVTDLSFCSCLESLTITDGFEEPYRISTNLPGLCLHDVATLKNVELCGWFPTEDFLLPSGCLVQ